MNDDELKKLRKEIVFTGTEFLPEELKEALFEEYDSIMRPQLEAALSMNTNKLFEVLGRALSLKAQGITSSEEFAFGQVRQFIHSNEADLQKLASRLGRDGHAGEVLRAAILGEEIDDSISLAQILRISYFLVGSLGGALPETVRNNKITDEIISGYENLRQYAFNEDQSSRPTLLLSCMRTARNLTHISELASKHGNITLATLIDKTAQAFWMRAMECLNDFCHEKRLPSLNLRQPPSLTA